MSLIIQKAKCEIFSKSTSVQHYLLHRKTKIIPTHNCTVKLTDNVIYTTYFKHLVNSKDTTDKKLPYIMYRR